MASPCQSVFTTFLTFLHLFCEFSNSLSLNADDYNLKNLPTTQSTGQPWPMPEMYEPSATILEVDATSFHFVSVGMVDCDILRTAYTRYSDLTFGGYRTQRTRYIREMLDLLLHAVLYFQDFMNKLENPS